MAGYQPDFSMSNSAVIAYNQGLMPASKLAKALGVSTAAVRAILSPSESHHTSSRYNLTPFYSLEDNEDGDGGGAAALIEKMREFDAARPADKPRSFRATVRWLEWSGSRKHPHAQRCQTHGLVTIKGEWAVIVPDDGGKPFRKGLQTRGFEYEPTEVEE